MGLSAVRVRSLKEKMCVDGRTDRVNQDNHRPSGNNPHQISMRRVWGCLLRFPLAPPVLRPPLIIFERSSSTNTRPYVYADTGFHW